MYILERFKELNFCMPFIMPPLFSIFLPPLNEEERRRKIKKFNKYYLLLLIKYCLGRVVINYIQWCALLCFSS